MSAQERRKFPRKPILESFHVFVVVPARGSHRLRVHDVSEEGIRFDFDVDALDAKSATLDEGDPLKIRFYLNATLSIPLELEIIRVEKKSGVRRVGARLAGKKTNESKAFSAFVQMVETLTAAADLEG